MRSASAKSRRFFASARAAIEPVDPARRRRPEPGRRGPVRAGPADARSPCSTAPSSIADSRASASGVLRSSASASITPAIGLARLGVAGGAVEPVERRLALRDQRLASIPAAGDSAPTARPAAASRPCAPPPAAPPASRHCRGTSTSSRCPPSTGSRCAPSSARAARRHARSGSARSHSRGAGRSGRARRRGCRSSRPDARAIIAEHSICQPGRPRPHGDCPSRSRPRGDGFHSTKSAGSCL